MHHEIYASVTMSNFVHITENYTRGMWSLNSLRFSACLEDNYDIGGV